MTTTLPKGGNASVHAALPAEGSKLRVVMEYTGDNPSQPSVDAVAFLLTENGKVRGDADMVFYNHKAIPEGGIEMLEGSEAGGLRQQPFLLDLSRLPPGIVRICLCLVADGLGVESIGQLARLGLRVYGGVSGAELVNTELTAPGAREAALIMAEIYLRNGEWKVKSIGQGFAEGLGALAANYGIVVAEAAQATGTMVRPANTIPAAATAAGRSATPAQRFERPGLGFGELIVNLTWNALPPPPPVTDEPMKKPGFLSALVTAKPRPMDLDLCCLYELADGHRGVIQALGDNFGTYNTAPFMELLGHEKGPDAKGEVIRINGHRWSEISRILVYAMIFDGVPDWGAAAARCVIRVPDQVPVSVKLDHNVKDKRACTVALIENVDGHLTIQKRVEVFRNPRAVDDFYGWGLRWAAGTKD